MKILKLARNKNLVPILVLFLIPLLYFYPFLQGYIPYPGETLAAFSPWNNLVKQIPNIPLTTHNFWLFDAVRAIYPWQHLGIEIVKSGQWPLWNPYTFGGAPLLANNQSALLYPLNLLYLIFDFPTAWGLLTLLQPVLAGLFMYHLLGEYGLSRWPRLWGALLFAWSGFFASYSQAHVLGQTMLWLPLILLAVHKLAKRFSAFWGIIFVFATVSTLVAGFLQVALYILIISILYAVLFLRKSFKTRGFIKFGFLLGISLGLASPQLFSTLELAKDIVRDSSWYTDFLLSPIQLARFLLPHILGHPATGNWIAASQPKESFYIGALGILFALVGFFVRRKNPKIKFWSIVVIVILLLVLETPLTRIFYNLLFPELQVLTPLRALGIIDFALAILSATGLAWFIQQRSLYQKKFLSLFLVFLVATGVLVIYHFNISPVTPTHPSTLLFFWLAPLSLGLSFLTLLVHRFGFINRAAVILVLLMVGTIDLVIEHGLYARNFIPKNLIFPETALTSFLETNLGDKRFLSIDPWTFPPNTFLPYRLKSLSVYDPVHYQWSHKFAEAWRQHTTPNTEPFTRAVELQGLSQNLLNLTNIKYVISPRPLEAGYLKFIGSFDSLYVYENPGELQHVFLVGKTRILKSDNEVATELFNENFNPVQVVLLTESFSTPISPGDGNIRPLNYTTQDFSLEVTTSTPQALVISESFSPGWRVNIDGQETKVYRADLTFQTIVVPKGSHLVSFSYRPRSFSLGLVVSLTSVILFIIFLHLSRLKSKNRHQSHQEKNLAKIWEQVPPDYYERGIATNPLQRIWHGQKIETFKKLVARKDFKRILDVGCAAGTMTNKVSQTFPKSEIFGVDVYQDAIDYARKKYPKIRFLVADAHKLPFPKNSFDLVICYETIEHVVNPGKVLSEMRRVVKPRGQAIVAMDSGNLLFRVVWWFWEKTRGRVWQGAHLHPFHHSELEAVIRNSKLKIIKKQFSHFGLEVSFLLMKAAAKK